MLQQVLCYFIIVDTFCVGSELHVQKHFTVWNDNAFLTDWRLNHCEILCSVYYEIYEFKKL